MAYSFGAPKIVTNGLVLYLDAANRRSYPGSGTAWNDLSGNRNYTMYGTVPYLSEVGGCWDFTGLASGTSYTSPLGFTSNQGIPFSTTESFTVSSWIYQTTTTGQVGLFANASSGNGFRFGPSYGGVYYLIGPTYKEGVIGAGSFSLNNWTMITAVFDRQADIGEQPTVYAYVNGERIGQVSQSSQTAMTTTTPNIVRSSCCTRFIGKLATLSVHSIALTDDDVFSLFSSQRRRFGL